MTAGGARAGQARAEVVLRVPFYDCDPLGVVWHGHYLKYFDRARSALMSRCGIDVPDLRALGLRMVVADARCRYTFPLSYGEELRVVATLIETTPLLHVSYRATNVTCHRPSARGYTKLATTDAQGELLPQTPPAILDRLGSR